MARCALSYLIILGFGLISSLGCASQAGSDSEPGDTLITAYGANIMVPRGPEGTDAQIFWEGHTTARNPGEMKRWVSIKTVRLHGEYNNGKDMAHAYWEDYKSAMELASIPTRTKVFEVGHGDFCDYALIGQYWSIEDPEPYLFIAECVAPLDSQVLVVSYIIRADAYDEFVGGEELRRFAKRVRLVDA